MKNFKYFILTAILFIFINNQTNSQVIINVPPQLNNNNQTLPYASTFVPASSNIIQQHYCSIPTVHTISSVNNVDYSDYYKKPLIHNNLIQNISNTQNNTNIQNKNTNQYSTDEEYDKKMNLICQNFLRAKRQNNYRILQQNVYHREVMSFKKFAESCTDYIKNNRLIWSGLNPQHSLPDVINANTLQE